MGIKWFFISIGILITGCSIPMKSEVPPNTPIKYQEGFRAGCDSGYVAAGHPYYRYNKDVSRTQSDPLYKDGWNDGFNMCKGKYENIKRSIGY